MRIAKGGTDMWRPNCESISTCKAIPAAQVTFDAGDYAQRMHYEKHPDINFFQRGRECQSCGYSFVSAEVDLAFLEELVELRNALHSIKSDAESYVKESEAAAMSLGKLTKSLKVLRALKIYQRTNN